MFRAALRSVLARKVRLLLTGLAVLLGVSFMSGTYVLTDTMTAAFNDLVDTGYAQIDVLVRRENAFTAQTSSLEERASMPDSVLSTVEQVPGVARAVGDVLGYAQIVDPGTGKVIGTFGPPTAAASWNTLTGFTLEAGRAPRGDDEVVIDSGSAVGSDIGVGERVEILFEGPPGEFEVVGIAGYGDGGSLFGATFALFDLPTAQRSLGKEGELDSIAVVADEGESGTALANRVTAAVPDGIEAVPASTVISEQQDQVAEGLGYLRTAFLVFAYVALFVGAFIIFNTFAIIVAQRTRELALFRALGAGHGRCRGVHRGGRSLGHRDGLRHRDRHRPEGGAVLARHRPALVGNGDPASDGDRLHRGRNDHHRRRRGRPRASGGPNRADRSASGGTGPSWPVTPVPTRERRHRARGGGGSPGVRAVRDPRQRAPAGGRRRGVDVHRHRDVDAAHRQAGGGDDRCTGAGPRRSGQA